MWNETSIALIAAIIVALPTAVVGYLTLRQARQARDEARQAVRNSRENTAAIHEVHISLNDRLTQLLDSAHKVGHAEGVESERGRPRPERGL